MLDRIKALCDKIVDDGDKKLAEIEERHGESDFYYGRYDPNEGPYSAGNADDVYSDGFEMGNKYGVYDLALIILGIIREQETKS